MLDPLRPQGQKLLHTGYKTGMPDMLKETQDSSITKKQKTMKNNQAK